MDTFFREESIWLLQNTLHICQLIGGIMRNVFKQNPGDMCSLSSDLKDILRDTTVLLIF